MNRIHISLLTLLALPLAAQDSGFSAGGGLILAPKSYFGSYDLAVHNNLGYYVNGSYQLGTSDGNISGRVSLGVHFMPGKTKSAHSTYQVVETAGAAAVTKDVQTDLKTSLTLYQVSGDLLIKTSVPNLSAIVGVSVNKYAAKFEGTEVTGKVYNNDATLTSAATQAVDHDAQADHHFPFKDDAGIKAGLRVGVQYSFTKSLSAELLLQQTELAGQNGSDPAIRAGGVNPAWLQLGVRYNF